jgi:hypothetical protein
LSKRGGFILEFNPVRRHLLGVSLLVPVLLCSCSGDGEGTYLVESPQQIEVTTDNDRLAKAEYEVVQKLAAKETRPDGTTAIPSMRQASVNTTALDKDVTLVGERRTLNFVGVDGTQYEIERLIIPKRPTKVTMRTSGGPDPEAAADELASAFREALSSRGLVQVAPAAK